MAEVISDYFRPATHMLILYMREDILNTALKKFKILSKKYNKFINVFVDGWRGFRFVFDTEDVRKCGNDCLNCDLYKLLKKEKIKLFSAGLYPASEEDKKIFGPQNFLNCKTFAQYVNCYANFLIRKAKSKREIIAELKLIEQSRIIYSKNNKIEILEKKFKKKILHKVFKKVALQKKLFIMQTTKKWK